jgi:phage head maturation protease
MWVSTLPDDEIIAGWWRASEEKARREAVLADARRRNRVDRLRRRVDEVNRQLDAVVAAEARRAACAVPNAPVEFRSSSVAGVNCDQRIVEVCAVPYGQSSLVEYRGAMWEESFDPGAFDGIETRGGQVRVNRGHDRTRTVGKVVRWSPSRTEGLIGEVRIAPTPLGDETLTLADEDMLSVSVGFAVRNRDQVLDRSSMTRRIRRAFVDHLSFVEDAAYPSARVLAVRGRAR